MQDLFALFCKVFFLSCQVGVFIGFVSHIWQFWLGRSVGFVVFFGFFIRLKSLCFNKLRSMPSDILILSDDSGIEIDLPAKNRDNIDSIIILEME